MTPVINSWVLRFSIVALLSILATGCTGNLFGVNLFIVGEQTSLEKQVLGSYAALSEDLLIYSSVRGVDPDGTLSPPPPATDSQRAAYAAMQNREYNNDDIQRMLRLLVVGEAADGTLSVRDISIPVPNLSQDEVQAIVDEENRDRGVIIERLLTTTISTDKAQADEVRWIFARINQDAAPQGAWVQSRAGEWIRK